MICISKRTAWHVQKFDQGKEFFTDCVSPPFPLHLRLFSQFFNFCHRSVSFTSFFKIISIEAKGNRKGAGGDR